MIRIIRIGMLMVTLSVTTGLAAETAQGGKEPCQCRDRDGQRRDLGSTDCFDISGTRSLYRCEMSTNTPYWKRIDDQSGCPMTRQTPTPVSLDNTALAYAD